MNRLVWRFSSLCVLVSALINRPDGTSLNGPLFIGLLFIGLLFIGLLFIGLLFIGLLFIGLLFIGPLFFGLLFIGLLFFGPNAQSFFISTKDDDGGPVKLTSI
jgi:hypothetical protein